MKADIARANQIASDKNVSIVRVRMAEGIPHFANLTSRRIGSTIRL